LTIKFPKAIASPSSDSPDPISGLPALDRIRVSFAGVLPLWKFLSRFHKSDLFKLSAHAFHFPYVRLLLPKEPGTHLQFVCPSSFSCQRSLSLLAGNRVSIFRSTTAAGPYAEKGMLSLSGKYSSIGTAPQSQPQSQPSIAAGVVWSRIRSR